jgi:hypothetical protein
MYLVDGRIVLTIVFFFVLPVTDAKTVRMKLSVLGRLGMLLATWLSFLICRTDDAARPVNAQPRAFVTSFKGRTVETSGTRIHRAESIQRYWIGR